MTEKMRVSIDVDVTVLDMPAGEVLENFVHFAERALDRAQQEMDDFYAQSPKGVTTSPPYRMDTSDVEVYESIPDMFCADCGKGEDEMATFVVTTLDYHDIKHTRTEVCIDCWKEENTT